ncbi:MAG: hypothetical protein NUV65_04870 [Candidatus Roizmanbacteria bacterium]|nr:hypothetical protein [Candidatus Roizmanbacteria bacterium]
MSNEIQQKFLDLRKSRDFAKLNPALSVDFHISETSALNCLGDYSRRYIVDACFPKPSLVDIHRKRIESLLNRGRYPFIILDIGGMLGKSMGLLADEFRVHIDNSQMAIVVSNLYFDPLKRPYTIECPTFDPGKSDVYYLTGSSQRLRKQSVILPDGTVLPLRGNVALMNEAFSLSYWSPNPSREVIEAASLLRGDGLYMVYSHKDESNMEGWMVKPIPKDTRHERQQRLLRAYETACRLYGLTQVTAVEVGTYDGLPIVNAHIFRKQNALPFEV